MINHAILIESFDRFMPSALRLRLEEMVSLSNHGKPIMEDCLFCKIAGKEIPAKIVYEDDFVIGFLDINPLAPGHTVIIPKSHAENILDLPDEAIGPLFQAVKKMTKVLDKTFIPDAFTIGINQGEMISHVPHFHVHIIPRFKGDGEKSLHSIVHNPPKESLDEIGSKIISNMK